VPELVPYLAFVLFRIPLALTIIQILAVDLGTDMLPALGLGAEKPAPDLMRQPPRKHGEKLIDWRLLARAYLFLGPMQAVAAMAAFWFVLSRAGWEAGTVLDRHDPLYMQGTTACLAAIIVMQIVNVFICKTAGLRWSPRSLLDNRLLLCGVALEVVLIVLIVYTAPGQALFGTAALNAAAWLFMLPFAIAMLLIEVVRRAMMRRV
jgi:magnesium-transporting ATPase (P-type)